jgi:PAS domain S-box-containing protein
MQEPARSRVLYIDDEPGLLEVTRAFLELDGTLEVDIEQIPLRALERLSKGTYDAIISDYQMPEMTGIDLLKRVRSSGSKVPFILFTGKGREDVAIQALNNGADFYLQKGGDPMVQFGELRNVLLQLGEKIRAQRALDESENKYRQLVESANSIILKMDIEGHVLFVNGPGLAFFGLPSDEAMRNDVLTGFLVDNGILDDLAQDITKIRTDPSQFSSIVHRSVLRDGREAWISWTIRAIVGAQGQVEEMLCIGNDISARLSAERNLEISHALLRTTLESIDEGVVVISDSGMVELFNDNLIRMLGIPPSAMAVNAKEPVVSFISTNASNWQDITRAIREIKESPMERSFDVLEFRDGRVLEVVSTPYMVGGKVTGRVWSFRYALGSKREADVPFSYRNPYA